MPNLSAFCLCPCLSIFSPLVSPFFMSLLSFLLFFLVFSYFFDISLSIPYFSAF